MTTRPPPYSVTQATPVTWPFDLDPRYLAPLQDHEICKPPGLYGWPALRGRGRVWRCASRGGRGGGPGGPGAGRDGSPGDRRTPGRRRPARDQPASGPERERAARSACSSSPPTAAKTCSSASPPGWNRPCRGRPAPRPSSPGTPDHLLLSSRGPVPAANCYVRVSYLKGKLRDGCTGGVSSMRGAPHPEEPDPSPPERLPLTRARARDSITSGRRLSGTADNPNSCRPAGSAVTALCHRKPGFPNR
jgi:hypothetical protein